MTIICCLNSWRYFLFMNISDWETKTVYFISYFTWQRPLLCCLFSGELFFVVTRPLIKVSSTSDPTDDLNLVATGSSGMKSSSFGLGRSYTQKFCYKSLVPWFLSTRDRYIHRNSLFWLHFLILRCNEYQIKSFKGIFLFRNTLKGKIFF